MSADGASIVVTLVCKYDGRGDVVTLMAWTPPAMRELMVAADWFAHVSLAAERPKLSSERIGLPPDAVCSCAHVVRN